MSDDNNPYAVSNADLEVPRNGEHVGGSLESGIAGEYDFVISEVLKEAWDKTYGLKGSFWLAAILLGIGMIIISSVLGMALGASAFDPNAMPTPEEMTGFFAQQMMIQLIMMVILAPFMTGMMMMGVKRSVDRPVSFKMMFGYFSVAVPTIIAVLLTTILTWVGLLLLIIPGLYLAIAYGLTIPLVGDKKLSAWQAMEASRKAITKRWFKFLGLYIVMMLIVLVSIIPLGIGLIWTYPMFMAVIGILYRDIFGVTSE